MVFSKKINCKNCSLKCEIYKAAKENGVLNKLETLHAIYNKHEIISKQGADVTHTMFLISGYAKLFIEGINQRNILLYILKPYNYIGLLSFFEGSKYSYSVAALEKCHICMVDTDFVKQLYTHNNSFLMKLNGAFVKSVSEILRKIISVNQKQIRGRIAESLLYLSKLHDNNKFTLGITRKELGEMAAISEENAVRILTEFRKEDIINIHGKELEILDMKLMKRISELG